MGYETIQGLAKVFNRVPTYDELVGQDDIYPQDVAPAIRRPYTEYVTSPYYIRDAEEALGRAHFLNADKALQHLGGGLAALPP